MSDFKKRKEGKRIQADLMKYLENLWKKGYNPSIKDLKDDLHTKNLQLLKRALRNMRVEKILDGSYDDKGIYRIYPFNSISSKSILYSNLYQ